jgi:DHA1 family bicyclomycin/chloramphenicol resistance-like MFS transporter
MTSSRNVEFIILVALLNAITAMSIDTMLPAVGAIANDLGVADPNHRQFIITAFFGGMTFGTLIFGPLSDSIGRKPAIYAGILIYIVGSFLCFGATGFSAMLIGRFIAGFGAASPRIVSMALVRDGLAGSSMARVMSFVMTVFMIVPIIAPSIGQVVLLAFNWRVIFAGLLAMTLIAGIWFAWRQEETLPKDKRRPFSISALYRAGVESCRHPVTMGYTLASGFIFAALIGYLGTSQQIFAELYQQGPLFAFWFALFASAIAIAMILNGRFVMKIGMRRITKYAIRLSLIVSLLMLVAVYFTNGLPPLPLLGLYCFVIFFCNGLMFGNYNALALEPMGHIAGMASSVSGFLYSMMSFAGGSLIGQAFNGTVTPLVIGFGGFGFLAMLSTEWAEARRPRSL